MLSKERVLTNMVMRDGGPTYKLRFPFTGSDLPKYLMFSEDGCLLIETEDYSRPYDERYTWLEAGDTITFLDSIGEEGRVPETVDGQSTPQTRAMLRRIMKQFGSIDDLRRCWKIIGVQSKTLN